MTNNLQFKNFEFPYNPSTLTINHQRNIIEFNSPLSTSIVQDLGHKSRVILGEGHFTGNNVTELYNHLLNTFNDKQVGLLHLPNMYPIRASFCSLSITAKPTPNLLYYSFKFMEVI